MPRTVAERTAELRAECVNRAVSTKSDEDASLLFRVYLLLADIESAVRFDIEEAAIIAEETVSV